MFVKDKHSRFPLAGQKHLFLQEIKNFSIGVRKMVVDWSNFWKQFSAEKAIVSQELSKFFVGFRENRCLKVYSPFVDNVLNFNLF